MSRLAQFGVMLKYVLLKLQVEKAEELKSEKSKESSDKEQKKEGAANEGGEEPTAETGIEVEGDVVLTETVPRGTDTTYHTRYTIHV